MAEFGGRRCSRYQFECHSSGECIAIYNACDGIPQCSDGSDEALELDCPDLGTTQPPVPTVSGAMINKDMSGQRQQQVINPAVRNQQYNSAAQTFRQQPNWQPAPPPLQQPQQYDGPPLNSNGVNVNNNQKMFPASTNLQQPPPVPLPQQQQQRVMHTGREGEGNSNGNLQWQGYQQPQIPPAATYQGNIAQFQSGSNREYEDQGSHIFNHKGNGLVADSDSSAAQYGDLPHNDYKYGNNAPNNYYNNGPYRQPPNWRPPQPPVQDMNSMTGLEDIAPHVNDESKMVPDGMRGGYNPPDYYYEDTQEGRFHAPHQHAAGHPMHSPQGEQENVADGATVAKAKDQQHHNPKFKTSLEGKMETDTSNAPKHSEDTQDIHINSSTEVTTAKIEAKKISHKHNSHLKKTPKVEANIEVNMEETSLNEASEEEPGRPSGAILSLALGLCITGIMVILIGCRLRVVRRRLRRGGKSPYAHDADYLVNGMYL